VVEGPVTTVTAGIFASLGLLNFYISYLIVVAGDLAGDALYYSLGRWGRKPLDRWGRFIGFSEKRIKKLEKHFHEHGGKTLIAGKLSHAVGGIVLVTAGVAKIPFRKFIWFNFWATLPKSLVLLLIGFYFGNTVLNLKNYFDLAWLGTLVIAIVLLVVYSLLRRTGKELTEEEEES